MEDIPSDIDNHIHDGSPLDEDHKSGYKEEIKYVSNLTIFQPNRLKANKNILCHKFTEPFDVIQIQIKLKENLVFTLCENPKTKALKFVIWNMNKELILIQNDLKDKILKFVVYPGRTDLLIFIGVTYYKFQEINYTNK